MTDTTDKKIGAGSCIVAGLGFLPGIGLIFAIISIILGLMKLEYKGGKTLIVLGVLGVFAPMVYASLFLKAFIGPGSIGDHLTTRAAQLNLTLVDLHIEDYKTEHGHYPAALTDLAQPPEKMPAALLDDPMQITGAKETATTEQPLFFYKLTPDKTHYYLLSVGMDLKPFTADDVLPDMTEEQRAKTGLLINPASLPVAGQQ